MKPKTIYSNILAAMFLTPLRAVVVVIAPLIPMFSARLFSCKSNGKIYILWMIAVFSSIVGLVTGTTDFANVFLYIWICFPIIYLLFGDLKNKSHSISWETFFKSLRLWVIIIDVIGFFCLFILFRTVDDFGRGYGSHFKGVSGLCVVNAFVMLYYLSFILKKVVTKKILLNFCFFFSSFIFCFSGLTLMTFAITMVVYFISVISVKNIIKILLVLLLGIFVLFQAATDVFYYNIRNIEYFLDKDQAEDNARKRVMYSNFLKLMTEDGLIPVTGTGPGGYNSRICFLLNDDADNIFTQTLGKHMPKYHKRDIYPLWNKHFVSYEKYNDGARNKPFSSLVSLCAETGIIFFLFFCFFWFKKIRDFKKKADYNIEYTYLFLINIFVFLLLATEYWFESSEFILFLIIQNLLISKKLKDNDTQKDTLLLVWK